MKIQQIASRCDSACFCSITDISKTFPEETIDDKAQHTGDISVIDSWHQHNVSLVAGDVCLMVNSNG